MDTTTMEGRNKRIVEILVSKVKYYYSKWKRTHNPSSLIMANQITGNVDYIAGFDDDGAYQQGEQFN